VRGRAALGNPRAGAPAPDLPRVLGLDEAGRGSVLGPLVVGGFLCDGESASRLRALGVRDSKQLSPARREELYVGLGSVGRRFSVELAPSEIDRAVRRHGLNRLEAEAFAGLIRRARPARVEADACDVRADRFAREIAGLAGFAGPVDARHRADAELPVVGAASIVAKVRRDAALRRLAERLGEELGSGYPSDARTIAHLRELLGRPASGRGHVRRSWATVERIMAAAPRFTLEEFGP
jgi:ribonuclease HII